MTIKPLHQHNAKLMLGTFYIVTCQSCFQVSVETVALAAHRNHYKVLVHIKS